MKVIPLHYYTALCILLAGCEGDVLNKKYLSAPTEKYLDTDSNTLASRINCPKGFERVAAAPGSFAAYLRVLPLKPFGEDVQFFDGTKKNRFCHVGVVDMDVGTTDLQQCADSGIRLFAEYLYRTKQYKRIHFNFTNGTRCDYVRYAEGWRMKVEGNSTEWYKATGEDYGYKNFRNYLDLVFLYAGSYSLSKELGKADIENIQPGDLFVHPGFPGHVEIVLDVCKNPLTGEKLFLLGQGFTPAQEIEVLENEHTPKQSPWYSNRDKRVESPQCGFALNELMRFDTF